MIHLRLITFRVKSLFIPHNNKQNKSACKERSAPGLDIHSQFCWSLGRPISCDVTNSSSDLLALAFLFASVVCLCVCVYMFAEIRINNTKCAFVIYICYSHSSILCTMQRQTVVHAQRWFNYNYITCCRASWWIWIYCRTHNGGCDKC